MAARPIAMSISSSGGVCLGRHNEYLARMDHVWISSNRGPVRVVTGFGVAQLDSAVRKGVAVDALTRRALSSFRTERGDVPGWVLIVLMTSALVLAVWAIAEPQLKSIVRSALDTVCGSRC